MALLRVEKIVPEVPTKLFVSKTSLRLAVKHLQLQV